MIMDFQASFFHNPILLSIFNKREHACTLFFLFIFISFTAIIIFVDPLIPTILFSKTLESKTSNLCDYSNGRWVGNDEKNGYYSENCEFLDRGFRCRKNGRKDGDYVRWRWQPDRCDLPRFNASDLLERSRNGRIVFAGDSLGRNQWESLICMLAQAVPNKTTIREQNGNLITKHKGFLSICFPSHNLTVEYYRTPFLVISGHPPPNSSQLVRLAIKVDRLHSYSKHWEGADVLVFNAGHWWSHDKTIKMGGFFHEGGVVNMTMDVMEAFRRSLRTWEKWVLRNLDSERTHIFFRTYSPVHYRGGGWNNGGRCDLEIAPETDYTKLEQEPQNNHFISDVIQRLKCAKRKAQLLNISYLSEFRIDGHPSIHREPGTPVPIVQDCSHWCLPGIPDTWNELLYAYLLSKKFRTN